MKAETSHFIIFGLMNKRDMNLESYLGCTSFHLHYK